MQLYEEVVSMIARSNTFQTLCKYRLSFNPTLTENFYMDGSIKEVSLLDSMAEASSGIAGQGNFYPSNNLTGKIVTYLKRNFRNALPKSKYVYYP